MNYATWILCQLINNLTNWTTHQKFGCKITKYYENMKMYVYPKLLVLKCVMIGLKHVLHKIS